MANETKQQPIKLNDYNTDQNTERIMTLEYKATSFKPDFVYVEKFSLVKKIPSYIPNIIYTDDEQFYDGPQNIETTYFLSYKYKTSLAVAVKNNTTGEIAYCNVRWQPQNINTKLGISQPSRQEILDNKYFHANTTIQLISMIETAIAFCLNGCGLDAGKCYFVKIESGYYQLQINDMTRQDATIYFNNELEMLFPFNFVQSPENPNYWSPIFKNYNITDINNDIYFVTQTIKKSSRIFPFSAIIFESKNLNVQKIYKTDNRRVDEILNYTLVTDDPDGFGDSLQFTLVTLNRTLKMQTALGNNFEIFAYFLTWDGFAVPIKLNYNEYCEMMIIFES